MFLSAIVISTEWFTFVLSRIWSVKHRFGLGTENGRDGYGKYCLRNVEFFRATFSFVCAIKLVSAERLVYFELLLIIPENRIDH